MAGKVMKRRGIIRTCQRYDDSCQGCPYVNNHGGCTIGQPWKQAGIHALTAGSRRATNENA